MKIQSCTLTSLVALTKCKNCRKVIKADLAKASADFIQVGSATKISVFCPACERFSMINVTIQMKIVKNKV